MAAAPIGLFAYNRPEHVARALRALGRCPELATSPLVIYCDGPKATADDAMRARIAETRRVARELAPAHAQLVEREHNLGLAKSMRAGVSALCDEHGRAIILEDDLEVSPTFLAFMTAALDRYADEPRVMQVSGYSYPVEIAGDDAWFFPSISCWGWGTWKRAWQKLGTGAHMYDRLVADRALRRRFDLEDRYPYFGMLQAQHRGEVDSWGIAWYLDVFAADGLVLYPRKSLVANRGHDGSGAHGEQDSGFEADAHSFTVTRWPAPRIDRAAYDRVSDFIASAAAGSSFSGRVRGLLRRARARLPV